ncbi:MAG: thioesterase family protein [Betaproteobacteria bacterium]|nr:thioesterase family protein [Betaproteobacteria bacterium]
MKPDLKPGLKYVHSFVVPPSKTVPHLYPESPEFTAMPEVFATGFMVGFLEWACIKALEPYLDWPREMTLGTHVDVSHEAPTPAGRTVTATVELLEVEGRRLLFAVQAHDGVAVISRGTHQRHVIVRERFLERLAAS